jgi:hypothetical protein
LAFGPVAAPASTWSNVAAGTLVTRRATAGPDIAGAAYAPQIT